MTSMASIKPVLDNNVGLISQQTETKTTSDADILDIFTGEQTDLKKVRIKIGDAEESYSASSRALLQDTRSGRHLVSAGCPLGKQVPHSLYLRTMV